MALYDLLRALTPEQRREFATACGLSGPNYLYQIAGGHRPNPSAATALSIEDTSRSFHIKYGTPIVTVREIVTNEAPPTTR